jgi:hypothetical protein
MEEGLSGVDCIWLNSHLYPGEVYLEEGVSG